MWNIVTFRIGSASGFLAKGRQDRSQPFMTGLLLGLVLASVFGLLGGLNGIGRPAGFVGVLIAAIILTVLFVVGVWIGDPIEARSRRICAGRIQ